MNKQTRILQLEQDERDLHKVLNMSQTSMKAHHLKPSDIEHYRQRLVRTHRQLEELRRTKPHKSEQGFRFLRR